LSSNLKNWGGGVRGACVKDKPLNNVIPLLHFSFDFDQIQTTVHGLEYTKQIKMAAKVEVILFPTRQKL